MKYGHGAKKMQTFKRGDNFLFQFVLANGETDRFIEAKLYKTADDSLVGTYDIPYFQDGIYQKKDIQASEVGYFILTATVFKDAGFTNRDRKYAIQSETLRVENTAEEINSNISGIADIINENIDDSDGRIT